MMSKEIKMKMNYQMPKASFRALFRGGMFGYFLISEIEKKYQTNRLVILNGRKSGRIKEITARLCYRNRDGKYKETQILLVKDDESLRDYISERKKIKLPVFHTEIEPDDKFFNSGKDFWQWAKDSPLGYIIGYNNWKGNLIRI